MSYICLGGDIYTYVDNISYEMALYKFPITCTFMKSGSGEWPHYTPPFIRQMEFVKWAVRPMDALHGCHEVKNRRLQ